jgi:hypothetical protein
MPSVKRILIVQAIIVALCAAGLAIIAPVQVTSFLGGAALITINFILLAQMWRGVLDKKPVARTILIVVIKYAILGALLYIFVRELNFPLVPLFVGVSTLGLSFVIAALQAHALEGSK